MTTVPKPLLCSISIVVYNPDFAVLIKAFAALQRAFAVAQQQLAVNFELYLIDNSETDRYIAPLQACVDDFFLQCPGVTVIVIKSARNLGYGYGNNLAINRVHSDYHLVMNPDVFVYPDTFGNALSYLQAHPQVGLLLPAVYGEDGAQHYLCKRNPTLFDMYLRGFAPAWLKKLFHTRMAAFEMRDHDYQAVIENVLYPSGCFMLFRTDALQKIGGFDERFFMYIEDADIGRRLLKVAHSHYVPDVKIIHKWARKTHSDRKLRWITVQSVLRYWQKYGGWF